MNNVFARRRALRAPTVAHRDLRGAVKTAAAHFERARVARDRTLQFARAEHSVRELATLSGLGPTRVHQITSPGRIDRASFATGPPIEELDLEGRWDGDQDQEDRILSIYTVAPDLPRAGSERELLEQDPRRAEGHRYDFSFDLYDVVPTERWLLVYSGSTGEVYVFRADAGKQEGPVEAGAGSPSGPAIVLGHLASYSLAEAAFSPAIERVAGRPGGVAWAYGRIRLANRLLSAYP